MWCFCIILSIRKGGGIMATVPTQIRIDENVKAESLELLRHLGLDLSSAINIFLRQCLIKGGLPFTVEDPHYNKKTLEALVEAKRISRDPNVPSYETMDELKAALESD